MAGHAVAIESTNLPAALREAQFILEGYLPHYQTHYGVCLGPRLLPAGFVLLPTPAPPQQARPAVALQAAPQMPPIDSQAVAVRQPSYAGSGAVGLRPLALV